MSDRTDRPDAGPSPAPYPDPAVGLNPTGRPRRSSAGTRRRKAKQDGGAR